MVSGVQTEVHAKLREWLATKTGETERQEALTQELIELLTEQNTAQIVRGLSSEEWNTPFGTAAFGIWLKLDPVRAASWIAERTDAQPEHAALVARSLLKTPAEFQSYCDQLPENAWKQSVLGEASLEMTGKDPVAAITFAQRLPAGDTQTNALETIAYDWFGRDLTAAFHWTLSVNNPALREKLLAVGAKEVALTDPDLAANWLACSIKTEGVLKETALSIVETWADQNPQQAATWVARFPKTSAREAAVDTLLSHWLKSDPVSANAWIQVLPERDAVFAKLKAEQAERELGPDVN